MKMRKSPDQSVSEFHTALKKKASELLIEESLVRIASIQGLEHSIKNIASSKRLIRYKNTWKPLETSKKSPK